MGWYVAPSLNVLLNEFNLRFPGRSKRADGSIGDASHQARPSDHNPDWRAGGVVRARDFTHDPVSGCDVHREVRRPSILYDPRTKYIISNGKIMSYYPLGMYPAYAERPYSGSNQHKQHAHLSIKSGRMYEDDKSLWYEVSQEDKVDAEVAKKFEELEDDIEAVKKVLGPYGGISKALFKQRYDKDGKPVKDSRGKNVYDEHLDILESQIHELAMHMGVLIEKVDALASRDE